MASLPWSLSSLRRVNQLTVDHVSQNICLRVQRVSPRRVISTLSRRGRSEEKTGQKKGMTKNPLFSDGLSPRAKRLFRNSFLKNARLKQENSTGRLRTSVLGELLGGCQNEAIEGLEKNR